MTPRGRRSKLRRARRLSCGNEWRMGLRLNYTFELSSVATPRFSVEAVEGIGKIFTLATLVLNVLDS